MRQRADFTTDGIGDRLMEEEGEGRKETGEGRKGRLPDFK